MIHDLLTQQYPFYVYLVIAIVGVGCLLNQLDGPWIFVWSLGLFLSAFGILSLLVMHLS